MESIARSSEYHGEEDSQNSEPNEDNDSHNANTGNPGSSNASETTQVPNDEVENNRADDDGTSSIMNQSDANTIISSQIRVEVADEATKETEAQVLIPGIEETDPMMEETAPQEEAAPMPIVVYEYPNAGIIFDPPFVDIIQNHELIGGFSVPTEYAGLYERI